MMLHGKSKKAFGTLARKRTNFCENCKKSNKFHSSAKRPIKARMKAKFRKKKSTEPFISLRMRPLNPKDRQIHYTKIWK